MPESMTDRINDALTAYNRQKLTEASQLFSGILADDPASFEANHLLAVQRAKEQRPAEGLILIDAALKANPQASETWRHRGNILLGLGLAHDAATSNEKAAALKAQFFPLFEQSNRLRGQNRLEEALALLDQALAIGPYNPQVWNDRGTLLADMNRPEEALAAFDRALALKPDVPEGHFNRGNMLEDLKRHEEALAAYDRAIAIRPHFAQAINNRGVTLWSLERFDDALTHFKRALALKPDLDRVLNNMGAVLCESGKVDEAFSIFRELGARGHALAQKTSEEFPPHRLKHDAEQRAYLAEKGRLASGFQLEGGERLATAAINPANANLALSEQWKSSRPQIVVIDDFLTPEALTRLRDFCNGSTVWQNNYANGYLGAMAETGLACPLMAQIAEELSSTYPAIFHNFPLRYLWAFKYDSSMKGTNIHADEAAVNVNFWITPDEANLDPDHGGLVVWDVAAPLDWNFAKFNGDHDAMRAFLTEQGAKPITIPYRANRAVIFDSDLFHETDTISFKDGHLNRRINVTLLYGRRA